MESLWGFREKVSAGKSTLQRKGSKYNAINGKLKMVVLSDNSAQNKICYHKFR